LRFEGALQELVLFIVPGGTAGQRPIRPMGGRYAPTPVRAPPSL